MQKCSEIIAKIEEIAPPSLAESWDNVGLITGNYDQLVNRVFLCLDVTSETLAEAISFGADLIVCHHPVIFSPQKRIIEQDISGHIIRELISNNISVYTAHTNFDKAEQGMNTILAKKYGLSSFRPFTAEECRDENGKPLDNIGVIGNLPSPVMFEEFIETVNFALNCASLKYVGDISEKISSVALCSGGGGDYLYSAYRAGADVYVSSDFKHHQALLAQELGVNLIDAGHFETENVICEFMSGFLGSLFPAMDICISASKGVWKGF